MTFFFNLDFSFSILIHQTSIVLTFKNSKVFISESWQYFFPSVSFLECVTVTLKAPATEIFFFNFCEQETKPDLYLAATGRQDDSHSFLRRLWGGAFFRPSLHSPHTCVTPEGEGVVRWWEGTPRPVCLNEASTPVHIGHWDIYK